MKKKLICVLSGVMFLCMVTNAAAQAASEEKTETTANLLTHKVAAGETVMLICKKYLIRPDDVYKVNPGAVNGLHENMLLNIPADKSLMSRTELEERLKPKPAPTGN